MLNRPTGLVDPSGHSAQACNNFICAFFAIEWGDAFNDEGLEGNWYRLFQEVWWNEQRPSDLGTWSTLNNGSTGNNPIDYLEVSDTSYVHDLVSRPFFLETALPEFFRRIETTMGSGNMPNVGFTSTSHSSFTLSDSKVPGKYSSVEWYLGSYDVTFAVTAVNPKNRTATVQLTWQNVTGWESATRIPRDYQSMLGTAIMPNRGGNPTPNAWIGGLLMWLPAVYDAWSTRGQTFAQQFSTTITMSFPNNTEPIYRPGKPF